MYLYVLLSLTYRRILQNRVNCCNILMPDVCSCRVFVDETYHGEVKSSAAFDADGYQYCIVDLSPGQTYDITVKVLFSTVSLYLVFSLRNCFTSEKLCRVALSLP